MTGKILEGPKLKYPVNEKSLGHFFFNSAEKYGDQICQVDGTLDKTETYASVKQRSTRVAIQLQKRGITSKDVIVFCSNNSLDITIPIIASFYLGAKVANLAPSLSVIHTKQLLILTTPKIIFVEDSALNLIEESLNDANFPKEIIVFGQSANYATFSDLVKPQENEEKFRPVDVDINDIALMFFSSGTTGLPKAICHSHFSLLCLTNQMYQAGVSKNVLHFTTFYWITAFTMLACSFKGGSYRVFFSSVNAEDTFRAIEQYKVNFIFTAPILSYKLTSYENAKTYDTSSVKLVMYSGTPMVNSQLQKMNGVFKSARSGLTYGMSEVGWVTSIDPEGAKKLFNSKLASCGILCPELRFKVVDLETNEIVEPNKEGEIHVLSPSLMKGYYNEDSSHVFDKEGYLKTGDVGYFDEHGCVYVTDRIKEMFKYQSWHIVPSSIEAVLLEHPDIKEAVVFGIPRGKDGEVPAACVVLNDNCNVTKEEIEKFVAERVSEREKLIGGISFTNILPKTPTGKVVRRKVRDSVIRSKRSFSLSTAEH